MSARFDKVKEVMIIIRYGHQTENKIENRVKPLGYDP